MTDQLFCYFSHKIEIIKNFKEVWEWEKLISCTASADENKFEKGNKIIIILKVYVNNNWKLDIKSFYSERN